MKEKKVVNDHFLFHVLFENNTKIGNISSLPASISPIMTNLDNGLKLAKLSEGPHAFKPGPMLLNVANIAERLVSTSNPSREIMIKLMIIISH